MLVLINRPLAAFSISRHRAGYFVLFSPAWFPFVLSSSCTMELRLLSLPGSGSLLLAVFCLFQLAFSLFLSCVRACTSDSQDSAESPWWVLLPHLGLPYLLYLVLFIWSSEKRTVADLISCWISRVWRTVWWMITLNWYMREPQKVESEYYLVILLFWTFWSSLAWILIDVMSN